MLLTLNQKTHTFKTTKSIRMPVRFKIKITKKILERSKECGTHNDIETIGNNCAIALALKEIFPDVFVTAHHIYPFGLNESKPCSDRRIALPKIALDFINVFDALCGIHHVRLLLPEFEFEISIPDEIISLIDIEEVTNILEGNGFPAPNSLHL